MSLIALLPLLLIFYFMLIRPQQKRMKEHAELIAALEVGDDVMLSAGIYGTVTQIDREMLEVEIAEGVDVRVSRNAVTEIVDFDAGDDDLVETDSDAADDEV